MGPHSIAYVVPPLQCYILNERYRFLLDRYPHFCVAIWPAYQNFYLCLFVTDTKIIRVKHSQIIVRSFVTFVIDMVQGPTTMTCEDVGKRILESWQEYVQIIC